MLLFLPAFVGGSNGIDSDRMGFLPVCLVFFLPVWSVICVWFLVTLKLTRTSNTSRLLPSQELTNFYLCTQS